MKRTTDAARLLGQFQANQQQHKMLQAHMDALVKVSKQIACQMKDMARLSFTKARRLPAGTLLHRLYGAGWLSYRPYDFQSNGPFEFVALVDARHGDAEYQHMRIATDSQWGSGTRRVETTMPLHWFADPDTYTALLALGIDVAQYNLQPPARKERDQP